MQLRRRTTNKTYCIQSQQRKKKKRTYLLIILLPLLVVVRYNLFPPFSTNVNNRNPKEEIMFASKFVRSSTTTSIALLRRSTSVASSSRAASLRLFSTAPIDDNNNMMTPESLYGSFESSEQKGNSIQDAMYALYTADAVCFDVDSTVIAEEGIDVLADFLGKGSEVAELTRRAMDGNTKFEDALQARLSLMKPSKNSILDCLQKHPLQLSPGIDNLMIALQSKNIDIWLVSGGFRIMIEPVAKLLSIPITNIVANTILFDSEGNYDGFDDTEPTSKDMGKPAALTQIKSMHKDYETMVMVGDGATDAQAKPPAKAFIGYGGVIARQAVVEKADWFVTDFDDLIKIVELRD